MAKQAVRAERFFKTPWFSKAAMKAHIDNAELCAAMQQMLRTA